MSQETPQKERLSVISRLAPAFLRSVITAVILAGGSPVSAAPMEKNNLFSEEKESTSGSTSRECMLNGYLKVDGNKIQAETLCHKEGNRFVLKNTVLLPDGLKHYNISGTNAYFYIGVNGEPLVSFIKEGRRTNGMLRNTEKGGFSFAHLIDFIYPDAE
jgi:hypothetical protein